MNLRRKIQLDSDGELSDGVLKPKKSFFNRLRKTKDKEVNLLDLTIDRNGNPMSGIINYKYENDSGYEDQKYLSGNLMVDSKNRKVIFANDNKLKENALNSIATIDQYSALTSLSNHTDIHMHTQGKISAASQHRESSAAKEAGNKENNVTDLQYSPKLIQSRVTESKTVHDDDLSETDRQNHKEEYSMVQKGRRKPPITPSVIVTTEPLSLTDLSQGEQQRAKADHPNNYTGQRIEGRVNKESRHTWRESPINKTADLINDENKGTVPVTSIFEVDDKQDLDTKKGGTQQIHSNRNIVDSDVQHDISGQNSVKAEISDETNVSVLAKLKLHHDKSVDSNKQRTDPYGSKATVSLQSDQKARAEKSTTSVANRLNQRSQQPAAILQSRKREQSRSAIGNRAIEKRRSSDSNSLRGHNEAASIHKNRDKRPFFVHRSTQSSLKSTEDEGFSTDTSTSELGGVFRNLGDQHKFIEKRSDALISFKPNNRCETSMISTAYDMAAAIDNPFQIQAMSQNKTTSRDHDLASRDVFHALTMQDSINASNTSTNTSYLNADGQSLLSCNSRRQSIIWPITWLYVAFVLILWTSVVGFIDGTENNSSNGCTLSVKARLWCCLGALTILYFVLEVFLERRGVFASLFASVFIFALLLISKQQPMCCYIAQEKQQLLRYLGASCNLCFACCIFVYWIKNGGIKKVKRNTHSGAQRNRMALPLALKQTRARDDRFMK